MRMLMLCCLSVCVVFAGCSTSGTAPPPPPESHPFALTERLEAVGSRQAEATEAGTVQLAAIGEQSTRTNEQLGELLKATESTNAKLSQLIDQAQLSAGQQCDLLEKLGQRNEKPEPEQQGLPLVKSPAGSSLFPSDIHIVIDGVPSPLGEFVERWYRNPWQETSGTVEDCLTRFGIAAEHIQQLSEEAKEQLHGALHEHQQSLNGGVVPSLKGKEQGETIRFKSRVVERVTPPAAPPLAASSCPGGVCPQRPVPQWSFGSAVRRRGRR